MSYDAHSDFGYSTIVAAPFPALTGVNLTVQAGQGALFPAVPFNCTVWPAGVQPLASNAEIVRVTAIVGDTFTITRAQEGTAAQPIAIGFQIANTTSVKVFTDIENSIIQFISAGLTKAGASEVVFADGNGISFGVAGQTVTASVAGAVQSTQPVAASASNGSFLFSTLAFANSNNVTFGTAPGQIIFASVAAQSAQPVAASASNGSFAFSTLKFSNANNVTFGTSAGGVITASVAPGAANVVISANNGSFQSSVINFEGDGNITVQTAGGDMVSFHVDLQSVQPVAASASNGSFVFSTLAFSNANGVTFGTSAGGIVTASVGAGASPGSISAAGGSIALGLVVFSNSNNVSFGMNGSTVTATVTNVQSTQPVAASASNGSFLFSTLGFSNANGVTFGTSGGSIISASVAGQTTQPVAASASNGSFLFSTLGFSNANGVTFGTSAGSIVTASVNTAGADYLYPFFEYPEWQQIAQQANTHTAGSLIFHYALMERPVTFNSIVAMVSVNGFGVSSNVGTSASIGFTQSYAAYSRSVTDSAATNFSNSSVWTLAWSASQSTSISASISGSSISMSMYWNTDSTAALPAHPRPPIHPVCRLPAPTSSR